MNRRNGKWVMPGSGVRPLLRLLEADSSCLPESVAAQREQNGLAADTSWSAWTPFVPSGRLNTLILKITKVCNYRCKYCYDLEPDDALRTLSYDLAEKALRDALSLPSGSSSFS